jgi:hypothetical protein
MMTYWPAGTWVNVNVPSAAAVVTRSGTMPGMFGIARIAG